MDSVHNLADNAPLIQFVMSAYCRHLDLQHWEKWRSLMVENATFEFENVDGKSIAFFNDPSEFIKVCISHLKDTVTVHHLHNQEIIAFNEHSAEAIWAMEDRLYFGIDGNHEKSYFHGYGHYHVSFVKKDTTWRISRLKLKRVRMVEQ